MEKASIPSTDSLLQELQNHVERLDLVQNLMAVYLNANDGLTKEAGKLFVEMINSLTMNLYDFPGELRIAMDVETHRGR